MQRAPITIIIIQQKQHAQRVSCRAVFSTVDDETVVFVLGDHGMTEDGNHGGATPEETGAALLVWSRSGERLLGRSSRPRSAERSGPNGGDHHDRRGGVAWGGGENTGRGGEPSSRKVAQIDLVPTVSLLLGTPIPFGSLGGVIPELFAGPYGTEGSGVGDVGEDGGGLGGEEGDPRYFERLCDALLVNSVQVLGFVEGRDATVVVGFGMGRALPWVWGEAWVYDLYAQALTRTAMSYSSSCGNDV